MFLRIFSSGLTIIALTACEATQSPEPEGDTIDCAIGAGAEFDGVCTVEWVGEPEARDFIIYHPNGGFRRFMVNEDATGISVKDGAEEIEMVDPSPEGFWQFSVAGDRYLVPVPPVGGV